MQLDRNQPRLAFFSDLYRHARQQLAPLTEGLDRAVAQYRGDDRIDGSREGALMVRNITYEIIESQVNCDIPAPKVTAMRYTPRRDRNAKAIENLCNALRDRLPFEAFNDIDERYTYIMGGSVWFVEWDETMTLGRETGGIRVSCISPRDFFPQPGVYELQDMEYCFLRFLTTRGELCRRYGVSPEQACRASLEPDTEACGDPDTVTVVVCFWRDENRDICRFVYSGDLVLSDVERYYARKGESGDEPVECPMRDIRQSDGGVIPAFTPVMDPLTGAPEMRPTCLPYYLPKYFPLVIRRNTSWEKQMLGQSDCDYLRPHQQAINKIESRILQKLLRSGVTPVVPEDCQVSVNNALFGQVIKLRPGESAQQYGTVDTTPDISRDIAEAERLYDQAKRIVGISDVYQGLDVTAANTSGYARQLQLNQAAGRLASKRRMKRAAYADLDRLIFSFYLAFADETRETVARDSFGARRRSCFNRYDFLEYDPEEGIYRYDDGYLFSAESAEAPEQQRDEMWRRNLENLTGGTLGDPTDPRTLLRYWMSQERVRYPYAAEQVEYFRQLLGSQEGGGGESFGREAADKNLRGVSGTVPHKPQG